MSLSVFVRHTTLHIVMFQKYSENISVFGYFYYLAISYMNTMLSWSYSTQILFLTSSKPLKTNTFILCIFLSDWWSLISVTCMCIDVGPLQEHRQRYSGHKPKEKPFPSSNSHQLPSAPQLGWNFVNSSLIHAGIVAVFFLKQWLILYYLLICMYICMHTYLHLWILRK